MVVFLVGLRPVAWNYFYRAKFLGPISVYFAVGLVGYSYCTYLSREGIKYKCE